MPHADSSLLPAGVTTKAELWAHIYEQLETLIEGQRQWASLSKKSSCQFIRAQTGKGVCADAYVTRKTVLVQDVNSYPGHIACDGATQSEIVAPVFAGGEEGGKAVGVLDLDCLKLEGFDEIDREGVERIARLLGRACDW
ncbi:hypothetical protein FRC10_000601 [Ceratobasidium sp. 414]|nr:hypothetical protein FRC10_000601 [Ceratobasidium sp. 414]